MDPLRMAIRLQPGGQGGEGRTGGGRRADLDARHRWTLTINGRPVHAVQPDSQFAVLCSLRLVEFLFQREGKAVERAFIAGIVRGTIRVYDDDTVVPKARCGSEYDCQAGCPAKGDRVAPFTRGVAFY